MHTYKTRRNSSAAICGYSSYYLCNLSGVYVKCCEFCENLFKFVDYFICCHGNNILIFKYKCKYCFNLGLNARNDDIFLCNGVNCSIK